MALVWIKFLSAFQCQKTGSSSHPVQVPHHCLVLQYSVWLKVIHKDVLVRIQTQSRLRCARFCLVPMAGTLEIVSLLLITPTLPQTHQHRRAHKHSVVGYCYWLEADAVRIACLVWRRLAFSFVRFFPLTKTTSYQSVTVKICILISHKYLSVAVPLELLFTLPSK